MPNFQGTVRGIKTGDLPVLKTILEFWIKDRTTKEPLPEEVGSVLKDMQMSIARENEICYVVAETKEDEVIGVMGFRPLVDSRMRVFATTNRPAELINAYVESGSRAGRGVGTALIRAVESEAQKNGFTEIILNSGPRYKDTAWGFYTRTYGEPVGIVEKMYGEGGDAPIWRKVL